CRARRYSRPTPFPYTTLFRSIEIVAWADEEGARFGVGLFGSAAAFGRLAPGVARRKDGAGVSIGDALRSLGEAGDPALARRDPRSEEHTSELQSRFDLVCRLL